MPKKIINRVKSASGFTLIELMIVVAVLSVMLLVLYQIWMNNERATRMLDAEIKLRDEARLGVSTMVRNLRMAEFDPATPNTSIQYIDAADASQPWPPPDNATFARGIIFR